MASKAYPMHIGAGSGGDIPDLSLLKWYDLYRQPYASFFTKVERNRGKYSQRGLATAGVDGCSPLIARVKNGSGAHGLMTHYVPVFLSENLRRIREIIRRHREMTFGETRVRIFHASCYKSMADRLEKEASRLFGSNVQLIKVPYDVVEKRLPSTGTEGVLLFDVSSGQYRFQPWGYDDLNPDFYGFL